MFPFLELAQQEGVDLLAGLFVTLVMFNPKTLYLINKCWARICETAHLLSSSCDSSHLLLTEFICLTQTSWKNTWSELVCQAECSPCFFSFVPRTVFWWMSLACHRFLPHKQSIATNCTALQLETLLYVEFWPEDTTSFAAGLGRVLLPLTC